MSSRRFYRDEIKSRNMVSFTLNIKETDLWVAVDKESYRYELIEGLENHLCYHRNLLENYIKVRPDFRETLEPFLINEDTPDVVTEMVRAANLFDVGPMAAVAGFFAETAGKYLLENTREVIVENGGDIFIKTENPCRVGIFAGSSPFSEKVAMEIMPGKFPWGICTSSGTVGHSYSRGKADAVVVKAFSAVIADAAATAFCNMVSGKDSVVNVIEKTKHTENIEGVLIICEDKLGVWGDIKLC